VLVLCGSARADFPQAAWLVRQHLKRTPEPLPGRLWHLLHHHGHSRCFRAERASRFRGCHAVSVPPSHYARNVDRALRASLQLYHQTASIRLLYVDVDDRDVDLAFDSEGRILYVHAKWLYLHSSHRVSDCTALRSMAGQHPESFFCDHVADELYQSAIQIITHELEEVRATVLELPPRAISHTRDRTRQMPRGVRATPADRGVGIVVTWTDGVSRQVSCLPDEERWCRVTLHHQASCDALTALLLHETEPLCSCATTLVSADAGSVTFLGLDPERWYFPMVSMADRHAFYAAPPPSILPGPDVGPRLSSVSPVTSTASEGIRKDKQVEQDVVAGDVISHLLSHRESPEWRDWKDAQFDHAFDRLRPERPFSSEGVSIDFLFSVSLFTPCHSRFDAFTVFDSASLLTSPQVAVAHQSVDRFGPFWKETSVAFPLSLINPALPSSESVLFIHDILVPVDPGPGSDGVAKLVVTRYSFLRSFPIVASIGTIRATELLLHYRACAPMGLREDAETLDIASLPGDLPTLMTGKP